MGAWCDCLRLSLSWTTDTLLSLSDWLNVRIIMRRSTRYVSMLSQTIQLLLSDPRNYSWWKSAGIWRWSRRLNAVYFIGYEGDYYVGRIPMISACLWILVSCITNLKSCLLFLPVISSEPVPHVFSWDVSMWCNVIMRFLDVDEDEIW